MGSEGWIKLYRGITEHWIWDDPIKFQRWIDLLLMANHSKNKVLIGNNVVQIEEGQKWTSIKKLAERWHCSKDTVARTLNLLQNDGMIQKQSFNAGTLITIVNYRDYQCFSDTKSDGNKYANKSTGRKRTGNELATNNNDKECIKNEKKEIGGRE